MKLAAILKSLLLVTAAVLLSACGGGGSSGGDSTFQPATIRITATPAANSVQSGDRIEIAVRVTNGDGSNISDGTPVSATVTPAAAGVLLAAEPGDAGQVSPTGYTIGGLVNFVFTGGAAGEASLAFSVADGGRSISTTVKVQVTPSPDRGLRINAQAQSSTLAAYTRTNITVRVTRSDGSLASDGTFVRGIVTPGSAGQLAAASDIDEDDRAVTGADAETQTIAGLANFTFIAAGNPGTATLTFTTTDPANDDDTAVTEIQIEITEGAAYLIAIEPTSTSVRMQSRTDVAVRVRLPDGRHAPDGTTVNAVVLPDSMGLVLGTRGDNAGPSAQTVGGVASFAFVASVHPGDAELQFSVADEASGSVVTESITMHIQSTPGRTMAVRLMPDTIPLNGRADIRLEVTEADGRPVPDGTVIRGLAIPSSFGALDKIETETIAGLAVFEYQAQSWPGQVELVFDATFADGAGSEQHVVGTAILTVVPTDDARLRLEATRTRLPVNLYAVDPFLGSPYMAEVTVTVKDSNGQPVSQKDGIQVSLNPVGNTGGFSTLDDPETECEPENNWKGCEFYIRMGQAPVDVVAGKATIFVHSLDFTGLTTLTVTHFDEVTQTTLGAAMEFEIVETFPPLPSQLGLVAPMHPIYVEQSGGNNSGQLHVEVRDAIGQPVPEPEAGGLAYNNYRLEIVDAAPNSEARLRAVNAQGDIVSGTSIDLRTTAGIGGATFIGGDESASYVIRLTADRADNNVDNGISDPITVERSVVVSDGRLFDLEITQPSLNALTINPSGGGIEVKDVDGVEIEIPVSPDGTYSVTVGVIATDRMGNPVLPGTRIRFGLIDEPQTPHGSGDFYLSGGDGDPQEGGTLFTATTGRFITAGGGAGPGDTLLVKAENVIGNRDMESARTVTEIHSETRLSVDYRFNHNDTTGQSVDYRDILPYVIGRAADGNIVVTADTNEIGVATTRMNYPVGKLGKVAAIWAQGDGPVVAGQPKKITDIEFVRFAGVANARLTVSPKVLPANTTQDVMICLVDALGAPMGAVPIDFAFSNLSGHGEVDDIPMAGQIDSLTGLGNGCATATVETSSLVEGDGEAALTFFAGGASDEVTFSFAPLVLLANPSAMMSGGAVQLRLFDSAGNPQPGFQLKGECTSSGGAAIGIASGPGVTNAEGRTHAVIEALNLNQVKGSGSGQCVFSTADGSATATVTLEGADICTFGISPPVPGCEDPAEMHTLTLSVTPSMVAGAYTVISSHGGACTNYGNPAPAPVTCTFEVREGTFIHLDAIPAAGFGLNPGSGWAGACQPDPANPAKASVAMDGDRVCQAVWEP